MSVVLSLTLPVIAAMGPVDTAMNAAEAPSALRAAFTVELRSTTAHRVLSYDPRQTIGDRWQLVTRAGEDATLDAVAAEWRAEAAPDGRLFADNVRANIRSNATIDDFGSAWRVRFDHTPVDASPVHNIATSNGLLGEAWIEPSAGRLMRLDYRLQAPVRQTNGSELTEYSQSYILEAEPAWGLTYIAGYQVSLALDAQGERQSHSYRATIKDASFFFANPDQEDTFRQEMRAQIAAY